MLSDTLFLGMGRFWGRYFLRHAMAHLRRRALLFDITLFGQENLESVAAGAHPYLMVSNHNLPDSSPFAPLAKYRRIPQYHQSPDGFIYQGLVQKLTGRELYAVAKCDRGWWSGRAWLRFVQRMTAPFVRGQIEVLPGYIAVENNPGSYQRRFLQVVASTIERGDPMVVFPGMIDLDSRSGYKEELFDGAAHLARRHGLPILPVCIIGSDSWARGHKVTIAFGEPLDPRGMPKERITQETVQRIRALYARYAPEHAANAIDNSPLGQEQEPHVAPV